MKRKDYPILEFDEKEAIIKPDEIFEELDISEYCVACFFQDVIEKLKEQQKLELIKNIETEMGPHPLYELEHQGKRINVFHPGLGAPYAAAIMDEVIAYGGRKIIACGGAGVLKEDMEVGYLVIPKAAIRDEGVSYHYLPPGREVKTHQEVVDAITETLEENNIEYRIGKTWTTSALFRETPRKRDTRKEEGCLTVEMECAALLSVAKFRGVDFGQILYGGDDVSGIEYDSRDEVDQRPIREKIFWLSVDSCFKL